MDISQYHFDKLYINGDWVPSQSQKMIEVINPTTEDVIARVPEANQADIDQAVQAAKAAFSAWNRLALEDRARYLSQLADAIEERSEEILDLIQAELGVATAFGRVGQVGRSPSEIRALLEKVKDFRFYESYEGYDVIKEGFGVVACITPWNYPLNQIQRKIAPALLAGNTVVVKPASSTPLTGYILSDIIDQAGFPAGVFNYLPSSGSEGGDYLAGHPDVQVVSFTGSSAVGRGLYEKASDGIKKLVLELGGKSPLIFLEGGDLNRAVKTAMDTILNNTGQSCSALTRFFVPQDRLEEAKASLKRYYQDHAIVGDPRHEEVVVGPQISFDQQKRVEDYIQKGIDEGAELFLGGEKLNRTGYFVQPTVFTQVTNDMTIAREEIFGPVLSVLTYSTVEEAIALANDTDYGLSAAVEGPEDQALEVARQIRAGNVLVNGNGRQDDALFGGYKQSGLGREVGLWGLEDYLEEKAIFY